MCKRFKWVRFPLDAFSHKWFVVLFNYSGESRKEKIMLALVVPGIIALLGLGAAAVAPDSDVDCNKVYTVTEVVVNKNGDFKEVEKVVVPSACREFDPAPVKTFCSKKSECSDPL